MLGIVFPHQCFAEIPTSWKEVWFVRHDIGYGGKHTTVANFHVARKIFLRAAEKAWIELARHKGLRVRVITRREAASSAWTTKAAVEVWDPVDHMLAAEIRKRCPAVTFLESPAFLLSAEEALHTLGSKPHDSHAAFYGSVRTRLNILMTRSGTPEGGRLRFDTENRDRIPDSVDLPDWTKELKARQSAFVSKAAKEIADEEDAKHMLGTWTGTLAFPTTHADAKKTLIRFCQTRLKSFGPYQDAMIASDEDKDSDFLFHSVISAPLNAGLLTPHQVLETVLAWKGKVPLASLEGFVAQVLGWREFMRAVYLKRPTPPPNRLKHGRKLSSAWYKGTTGLLPVDTAIQRVTENAYLHHIERLMVVGNAMFLAGIRPTDVYRWFMELFADSYDWVMIGNVYYMSQWTSDAITTKPYISSSAYVRRMSDYPAGDWTADWDALYWTTISKHASLIRKNYRLAAQVSFWEKKTAAEKRVLQERAREVLGRL